MLESEPDYQEHKQALQLYAAVLTGEQDVIFVTEDTSSSGDNDVVKYFSIAPVITTDGVFQTDDKELSSTGYARIAAFEEDGCLIEPVENYESGSHEKVHYYFFSEETMAQWLE